MDKFIVAVDDNANGYEVEVMAANEKDAYKAAWAQLTDAQRCTAASLDVVECVPA